MNVTKAYRKREVLCERCGKVLHRNTPEKFTNCFECRRVLAAKQRERDQHNKSYECALLPSPSKYKGVRPCAQQLSEKCLKKFLSPDRRAVHCCPPCRHVQLLQGD